MPQLIRISTGVRGLDEVTHGGFIINRSYLIRGGPGSGKSSFGLHFLSSGLHQGKKALFISLEESRSRIIINASQRGIDIEGLEILDISPNSEFFTSSGSYDVFRSEDVESAPLNDLIVNKIREIKPDLVFLDPMTQLSYLTSDRFQFRKQALSFIRFLAEMECTTLFTSEKNQSLPDDDLQFMADGVIDIDTTPGATVRTMSVNKFRGSGFMPGSHSLKLSSSGIEIFPRLVPRQQEDKFEYEKIGSGIPDLDEMLSGGLERGTVTIITGPSGVGKTTLGLQFMKEAAGRGERSVVYSFEEEPALMISRCDSIGIPARNMIERGTLEIKKIEPLEYTQDEFTHIVRSDVEDNNTRIVMLDSTAGYALSLRGEDIQSRLHALTKYLQNAGVAVLIINEINAITGDFKVTEAGISYLADNVVFLRFLEVQGEMRKAIGVLKKRLSDFEKTLREFEISRYGIRVGKPLRNLRGILSGTPSFVDQAP